MLVKVVLFNINNEIQYTLSTTVLKCVDEFMGYIVD